MIPYMNRISAPVLLSTLVFAGLIRPLNPSSVVVPKPAVESLQGPDEQFGKLFEAVQIGRVFPDSKTFADCTPRFATATILANYERERNQPGFNLKTFVDQNFTRPVTPATGYTSKANQSAEEHITALWPVLTRPADARPKADGPTGSLIPLPKPYVVPGGRFGEIYYWDSYFTMQGLQVSGRTQQIQNMIDNFAYLIDRFGFIPNGNRTYFLGRSQPPFFSYMISLLSEVRGRRVLLQYLPQLQKEYDFWMDGKDQLTAQQAAYRRVVRLPDGILLNRYYDDKTTPRPESYREDVELARRNKDPQVLYRHLRAGAESGWDYSSRWFRDGKQLRTIHTTDFIPVDLNCLLVNLERTLAQAYRLKGDANREKQYTQLASQRQTAIRQYCWNAKRQFFFDYDFMARKQATVYSLAAVYPLFTNVATTAQSVAVARTLERSFLKPGGLTTTLVRTGQQWDAPNGWAPLQWLAIQGLRNYRQTALASRIRQHWVTENLRVYKASGKMVEKYDVISTASAKGGEYPNQDGFGWTNGVLLRLLNEK
jgi:alpha,alpha-trehalase